MNENWKPVVGHEDHYLVSDEGRVRSLDAPIKRRDGGTHIQRGRLRKLKSDRHGYMRVTLSRDNVASYYLVHRLVAESFIPNPECLPVVNHIDGNPSNNHASNLEWCTQRENCIHALRTGLVIPPVGSSTTNAKLTEYDVRRIRALHSFGVTQREIARRFGICHANVSFIVNRKAWTHVP